MEKKKVITKSLVDINCFKDEVQYKNFCYKFLSKGKMSKSLSDFK